MSNMITDSELTEEFSQSILKLAEHLVNEIHRLDPDACERWEDATNDAKEIHALCIHRILQFPELIENEIEQSRATARKSPSGGA